MRRLQIWLQSFLILALNGVACSASCYRKQALVSTKKETGLAPAVLEVLEKGKSLNHAGIPQSFCPMPSHNIMTLLVYLLSGLSYFASGVPFIVLFLIYSTCLEFIF
jgi:hypothetical protein